MEKHATLLYISVIQIYKSTLLNYEDLAQVMLVNKVMYNSPKKKKVMEDTGIISCRRRKIRGNLLVIQND